MSDESQQDRQRFGTDITEVRHEPKARGWRLRLYVFAVTATPFLLIAGSVVWMMLPAYAHHAQYAYLANTGYGMRLHNANCDVLIYGDSTAMVGIMPAAIERRTGLKTCNIAEVAGVQVVNGMMVLDTYLKNNQPPKYLVFDYAPENLTSAGQWHEVSTFEGVFFRLQFRPDRAFWRTFLHDPDELVTDAELGLRTGIQWMLSPTLPANLLHERDITRGHVAEDGPALTSCPDVLALRPPDAAWLAHLRQTYSTHGTRVLIDVTPVPSCEADRAFYDRQFTPGLIDNTLGTLPLAMYTGSGRLHTNDAGTEALSLRIADQILQASRSAR